MSVTPGKTRTSIPTPGKGTGIPTPGRLRSASSTMYQPPAHSDDEYIARAFADAIKANDPGHHRSFLPTESSTDSLSPHSSNIFSQTGRRSSAGRPSSVASHTSAISTSNSRGLDSSTVGSVRPQSRTSDAHTRTNGPRIVSKAFDIGDNVRIESLGFEGSLRYLGEIDGKAGTWAGVELSGGFSGKGKNNGTVAGKQYFMCPPNCGVFVASSKLSAPTVGPAGGSRPSSVASSRSGRITPSVSGRVTPSSSVSLGNGRRTPSLGNGRITPSLGNGRVTPSAQIGRRTPGIPPTAMRSRTGTSYGPAKTPTRAVPKEENITPGSRASKYVGMTAKQLSSRGSGSTSPTRKASAITSPIRPSLPSPIQAASHLPSPTRSTSSPFNTPKAGRTSNIGLGSLSLTPSKIRISAPRPRVPSAIAMPPPSSPSVLSPATRSMSLDEPAARSASTGPDDQIYGLDGSTRNTQDRMAELMMGRMTSPSIGRTSRPASSASLVSGDHTSDLHAEIERLQARLDATENENDRLRADSEKAEATVSSRMSSLADERDKMLARVAELENSLRSKEQLLSEWDGKVEGLERTAQDTVHDLEKARSDGEARARDLLSKLEVSETLVAHLKEVVEAKEGEQSENNAVLAAKNAEVALLESRVDKAYADLEEERRALNGQVDELRKAGQETIALYEERLSIADAKRYEMEDAILALEEQLRTQARPPSPGAISRHASSATEIDNESLREQVQHLQKKISNLEDLLEDTRASADRDDAAARERIKRYKDREEHMRSEVAESRKEIERITKAEELARLRTEETGEALRESQVALDSAQAEVEGLRAEIAHLEGVNVGNNPRQPNSSIRDDRPQLLQEIAELKRLIEEYEGVKVTQASLETSLQQKQAELGRERQAVQDLRQQLGERTAELDAVRKKLNRDLPLLQHDTNKPPSPSKHDLSSAKDEITGLKHIVQQLQKESATLTKRNQVLEAENKLLATETEQLREDLKSLEDSLEQSIERDEQALGQDSESPRLGDTTGLQQQIKDQKAKFETEVEQLRKRLSDVEMKHARQVHDLNKEITELETLVEAKIYKEEDLERENEKLKGQLARVQKKASRPNFVADTDHHPTEHLNSKTALSKSMGIDEVCEICERPGHDIFTCDLLKGDGPVNGTSSIDDMVCEDCEERGHTAVNCPHSLDVF